MLSLSLAASPLCERAYINQLTVTGDLRRRLLDLGFTPGNSVTPLFRSPLGDPTAYAVMGSIIALRQEDAESIQVFLPQKEDLL